MEHEGTYVEDSDERSLDDVYRRRHRRLEGTGRFVRLAEEGGMGAVLEVRGADGRRLALKLIKDSLLADGQAAERFRRELASHRRLSAAFQVPRLVPCLDFADSEDPARVFGLFPFYGEGTLEDRLRHGLPPPEALWILADAVEGLQSLHGLQYVHRDVHSTNILVEREGGRRRGVLGDLGVGIFLSSNTIFSETELDSDRPRRVGHPGYIDPSYRASPEADMYAVGATLYRILAGRSPAGRRLQASVPLRLPPAVRLPGGLEARLAAERLLERLTTPEDGGRYPSVREAREELVQLAEILEKTGSAAPVVRRVTAGVPVPKRRVPSRTVLAAVVASGMVLSGATLLLSGGVAPHPEAAAAQEASHPRPLSGGATARPPFTPARERGATTLPKTAPTLNPPSQPPSGVTSELVRGPSDSENSLPDQLSERSRAGSEAARAEQANARGAGGGGSREGGAAPLPGGREGSGVRDLDALIRDRRYPEAEQQARTLWRQTPGDPEVAGRLALLLTHNRPESGWSEARAVLTLAVLRHADRGDLRLALARVSNEQGLVGSALRWLREAPATSSHRDQIEALRVTLERAGDRK